MFTIYTSLISVKIEIINIIMESQRRVIFDCLPSGIPLSPGGGRKCGLMWIFLPCGGPKEKNH